MGIGAVSPVKQSSHRRRQPKPTSQVRRYGRSCSSSRVTRHHALTAGACLLQPFSLVSASLVYTFNAASVRARPKRSTQASASLSRRAREFQIVEGSTEWERGIEPRANHPLYSSSSSRTMFLRIYRRSMFLCCTLQHSLPTSSHFLLVA